MRVRRFRLRRIAFLLILIGILSGIAYTTLIPPPGGGNADFSDGIYVKQGWFNYFVSIASPYGSVDPNTPYRWDQFGVKKETYIDYYIYAYDPDNQTLIYVWRFHKLKDQDLISVDSYHGTLEDFDRGLINDHVMDIQVPAEIRVEYNPETGLIWVIVNGGVAGLFIADLFYVSGVIKDGFMYPMDNLYPASAYEYCTSMVIVYTDTVEIGGLPFPGNTIYQVDYIDLGTHRHLTVSIPDGEKPFLTKNTTIDTNAEYMTVVSFIKGGDTIKLYDENYTLIGEYLIGRLQNYWTIIALFKDTTETKYYMKPDQGGFEEEPTPQLNVEFPEYRNPPDWRDLGGWGDYIWNYALPNFFNSIVNAFNFLGYIQTYVNYFIAIINTMSVIMGFVFAGGIAFSGIMSLFFVIEGQPDRAIKMWKMYIEFIAMIIKLIFNIFKALVNAVMKIIDILTGPAT